jgi:hypothetical protein
LAIVNRNLQSPFYALRAIGFAAMVRLMLIGLTAPGSATGAEGPGEVRIYPAPTGEELSKDYRLSLQGRDAPVYVTKVAPSDAKRRWKAMDDKVNSAEYFDKASFAYFDMQGPVAVAVACPEVIRSVKVLPTSYGIAPKVEGNNLSFTLSEPRQLTIEINGNWVGSLHLFANQMEVAAPAAGDPNVVYIAPGIHDVTQGLKVGDGKTVYLAGGAVLRGVGRGGPVLSLVGKNITLRGRGIIDGGLSPTHSRNLLSIHGSDITVEGIILRDPSTWTIPIRESDNVTVKNVKVLGYRANSDGIDICNSSNVMVEGCFLRTLDDLVVVKCNHQQKEARHVVVRNCVLWNQVAHPLSVGSELRENVDDVLFTDCDIIHDTGRDYSMRIFHGDSATVSNVRFENIRIEQTHKLISLWINQTRWSRDPERGHIEGVTFKNIHAVSPLPVSIELQGFDATHGIDGVLFDHVGVNGVPIQSRDVRCNAFVTNVKVEP